MAISRKLNDGAPIDTMERAKKGIDGSIPSMYHGLFYAVFEPWNFCSSLDTILPYTVRPYMPPLSPRLMRLEVVRGLHYPLFVVGSIHKILSIGSRVCAQAHAIRGWFNFQRFNALPYPVAFLYGGGKPLFPVDAAYDIRFRRDKQGGK